MKLVSEAQICILLECSVSSLVDFFSCLDPKLSYISHKLFAEKGKGKNYSWLFRALVSLPPVVIQHEAEYILDKLQESHTQKRHTQVHMHL